MKPNDYCSFDRTVSSFFRLLCFAVIPNRVNQGGYIAALGRTRASSLAAVDYLRAKHWLDRHTAGVVLEFILYNPDVNLGCLVRVFWQFPPGGRAKSIVKINSMRFYRSTSTGLYIFVLIFELLYLLYTLYMIMHEIKQIRRRKWRYFRSFSGIIDLSACTLSVIAIGIYLTFVIELGGLMSRYRRGRETVAYFSYLVAIDSWLSYVFAVLVVIGMLKFLHLLRFNPLIWRFMMILKYATPKLICALSIIVGAFLSFGSFMYVVGGRSIEKFSTMTKCLSTLYEGILGILYMTDLQQIDKFWGPFLYIFFLFLLSVLVLNLLIIVLIDALAHVSSNPMPNEETEILWMLVYKIVQYLGIKFQTN